MVTRNLLANFLGSAWSTLLALAVLPIVLKLIGAEGYGLVGVFATILALLSPLEAGLGTAIGRELAGRGRTDDLRRGMADVVRTLECVHWSVAAICGAAVAAVAPLIAHRWVQPQLLNRTTVETAVITMGVVIVFQWPLSLYSGALVGLQRQVLLNILNGVASTIRSVGSVVVLLVWPSVVAYFVWQIVASALHTLMAAALLWRSVPASTEPPRFRPAILRQLRRFLVGMSGTSVLLLLLTQLDKAILSRMLSLEMFGYYALAASVAANLLRLVAPVQQATFPRFAELAAAGDDRALATLYHQMSQLLAVLTIPLASVIIAFPRETLLLWTGDVTTAARTATILALLMTGSVINALLYPTYTVQIAHGWTTLIFFTTAAAAAVLVPALFLLSKKWGAVGAATVWPCLNVFFLAVLVPLMHRRLLRGEMRKWYKEDLIVPALGSIAVVAVARLLIPPSLGAMPLLFALALTGGIALVITMAAAPRVRQRLMHDVSRPEHVPAHATRSQI